MNPSFISINIGSALPVTSGGTGLTTIPTNGQLLIGNGTGYTLNPLTPGAGIGVTNGVGAITVANTGVLSNIASSGISVSSATGNVTIANTGVLSWSGGSTGLTPATATTGAVTLAGTLGAGYGGTGLSTYAIGDLLYASGATALSRLADVATGSALISGGVTTAPSWGKIGLTTHVSGTLPIANGGTNGTETATAGAIAYGTGSAYAFTAAGTSGQVLTSAGAGTPTWATPTTGTVTAVSVVSANGLAGTSSGGATPALTLSTTVTGVVKGNGTALSAATAATDYVAPSAYASVNGLTMATARLLGRTTASTGAAEEISVAGGLTLSGGTLTGTSGTVTAVSVVSANGLAGSSSGGATPALTLSTTITGLLKGNGTAISAATSGTDYAPATSGTSILYGNGSGGFSNVTIGTGVAFSAGTLSATGSGGTVTTVGWTGGIVSVANPTTTPAFTIAGTSGGIPYFSSGTTWATSAALAAGALVQGGGAGVAPSTITTGTGVVTALGVNTGTAGAFVVNGGALGTPTSGTVTNLTGTASININGTVGATTANTGAFTALSATSASTSAADSSYVRVAANKNVYFRDAGAIGGGLGGAAIQGATNGAAGWAALSFGATEYEWGVSGSQSMLLSTAGNLTLLSGNLVQGTAAKGVNFTANTSAAGMTSQLLNWYEEGTWTPVITFATPGDLSVTYSATIRVGTYTRIGNRVIINVNVQTATFTFTTASGNIQITGLPFTSKNLTASTATGSVVWGGITKVGYTQVTPRINPNTAIIDFVASGSAVAQSPVTATDTPTGGTINLRGTITYEI